MIDRMEASVVHSICTQLENLGWIVNERHTKNNVTQQRVKTLAQQRQLADANDGRLRYTALRFINEDPEILSAPQSVQLSREELIRIFKRQADLLREAGLQAGLERFGAFSDILFLKLMDEMCQIREHAGEDAPIPTHLRWSEFKDRTRDNKLEYVRIERSGANASS